MPGPDLIQVQPGGGGYIVTLNGTQVASSPDTNVILEAGGGNDNVLLYNVLSGSSITVRGSAGNDTVELGNGRLFNNLRGQVYIEELAGGGIDQLIANDSLDTTFPDWPVRARHNLLTSGGSGPLVGVHYDDFVENKSLLCSSAADTVNVESPAAGMTINLSGGDDTVRYRSLTANDLSDFMAPSAVNGADGFDSVNFDDSGGPFTEPRDYFIAANRFENQMLTGVEDAELLVRGSYQYDNPVRVTGLRSADGALTSITISGESNRLLIGSEVARIDAGAMSLTLDVAMGHGSIEIYDTKDALLVSPWEIFTTFAGRVVRRGFFAIIARDADDAPIHINVGQAGEHRADG